MNTLQSVVSSHVISTRDHARQAPSNLVTFHCGYSEISNSSLIAMCRLIKSQNDPGR